MSRECRECKSKNVKIVDADECSITVHCLNCGEEYLLEPDGFGEGGMEWVEAISRIKFS